MRKLIVMLVVLCNMFVVSQTVSLRMPVNHPETDNWPLTTPPGTTDPDFGAHDTIFEYDVIYVKAKVDGKWRWVVDEKRTKQINDETKRVDDLYEALRTRVISEDDLAEAIRIGWRITVHKGSFDENEKRREFDDAIYQQFRLRLAAKAFEQKRCSK